MVFEVFLYVKVHAVRLFYSEACIYVSIFFRVVQKTRLRGFGIFRTKIATTERRGKKQLYSR